MENECQCICHDTSKGKTLHFGACCTPCKVCGKNIIKVGFNMVDHMMKYHNEYMMECLNEKRKRGGL